MAVSIGNDHRIVGASSVNLGTPQGIISPTRIVIHYSGGDSLSGAITALKAKGFSYNVLIDKNGSYHQARAFNKQSSHAGRSNWKAQSGLTNGSSLNDNSIGISMINLGQFYYFQGGKWHWDWDNGKPKGPSVLDAQANKHALIYTPARPTHWTPYPQVQMDACEALVTALVNRYPGIIEIVGHHDIAIDQKPDPGPVCPLETWRVNLGKQGPLGLIAKVSSPDNQLLLRDRPSVTEGKQIRILTNGDEVAIRSVTYAPSAKGLVNGGGKRALSGWASVDIDGSNQHAGFVYMKYLTKTPLAASYANKL